MQVIFLYSQIIVCNYEHKGLKVQRKEVNWGRHERGGCGKGWRVNQWISIHPLMCASVNKALISFRHISWLSRPLGPSWLAEAARHSLETHLRVYRHLWLVIGNPREINGTMGAASQLSRTHTRTHRHEPTHTKWFLCMLGKLTFAVKIQQLY